MSRWCNTRYICHPEYIDPRPPCRGVSVSFSLQWGGALASQRGRRGGGGGESGEVIASGLAATREAGETGHKQQKQQNMTVELKMAALSPSLSLYTGRYYYNKSSVGIPKS
ncbi:hypothetical protein J6590_033395 [Homalodisca vitripennis]|nr:hypothetical protein J6590_033395 [Homalodisca vitripennis]